MRTAAWGALLGACAAPDILPDYDPPPEAAAWQPGPAPESYLCFGDRRMVDIETGDPIGRIYLGFDDAGSGLLEYAFHDANGNGIPEHIDYYTYDGGQWVRHERTRQGPQVVTRQLDDQGNVLVVETDTSADGTVDTIQSFTYDALGRRETLSWDWNGDGIDDQRFEYRYDEANRPDEIVGDTGLDGSIDVRYTYVWEHPVERAGELFVYQDDGDDGDDDVILRYVLDVEGRELAFDEDTNADGTWERQTTRTFDEDGRTLTRDVQGLGTAPFHDQVTYTYDRRGREVVRTERYELDGRVLVHRRIDTTYGGTCP